MIACVGSRGGLVLLALALLLASPGGASIAASPTPAAFPMAGSTLWGGPPHQHPGVMERGTSGGDGAASAGSGWNSSGACAVLEDHWNASFARLPPPLDVRHVLQDPCYVGHDEPSMSFLSNASYSGERVHFSLDLPPGGTASASAFSTFWVGLWLAGVPCSYGGQSYLEVQLNPPYDVAGIGDGPNWTLQAPVWDLVPAGSCDPQCQNDSVSTTIDGVGYCEDDAAISGVGTYTPTGWGNFAPGDALTIDLVGSVGGGSGFLVVVNDTTHPSQDLRWTYSAQVTATGTPLTPFYNASTPTNGGWGYGLNVEATWENCPEASGLTPCNSYDGPAVSAVGVPELTSVTFWNATSGTYGSPFPSTATSSSSGGCAGASPLVAPCFDFTTFGGTGAYPYWSMHAAQGRSWWMYGDAYADQVSDFGGPGAQFAPTGLPAILLDPTSVYDLVTSGTSGSVTVGVRVADPNGVAGVQITYQWCASMGSGTATLGAGAANTTFDGAWSTTLSGAGYRGTVHFEVRARSTSGVWSTPVYGAAAISGTTSCTFPPPPSPWFGPENVSRAPGGYRINWTENGTTLRNITLWLNTTSNGTPRAVDLSPSSAPVTIPVTNASPTYEMRLIANDWANNSSTPAPWVVAPPPGPPMTATLIGPMATNFWIGRANASFALNVTGALGGFTASCTFSDGSNTTLTGTNGSLLFAHDFGTYFGTARVGCAIRSMDGTMAASNPVLVPIWATPLGVPQTTVAGDGWVNVSWSPPASPAAPVTGYTVYFTTNPASSGYLTAAWPFNASAPYDITVWNTTRTHLLLPVPDGLTLYAQVVGWNVYGEGLLPSGVPPLDLPPVLAAVPAPLEASPIAGLPGGPAPFNDSFSSWVTGGTNFSVIFAVYTFPGEVGVTPTIVPTTNGTWVNVTYVFPAPGIATVQLHVVDSLYDTAIVTATVYVAPGAGPTVGLAAPAPFGWVGQPIPFTTTVSGGSGNYTYAWQFGDGAIGTGARLTHTYLAPGTFGVEVRVTDNRTGGTTTRAILEVVYALPEVAIVTTAGPNGSLSYDFTAHVSGGSGPPSVVWLFGDGSVGHGTSVGHDYGAAGSYTVEVIATDPSNHAAFTNITVLATSPSTAGGSPSLSGTLVALVLGPVSIACFVAMLYFWSLARPPKEGEGEVERPRFQV
ncbi:MAG: PKD domain-containing protein [Thermoplasmata archaeon]